jgi:hypothetical protein
VHTVRCALPPPPGLPPPLREAPTDADPTHSHAGSGLEYLKLPLVDAEDEDILSVLPQAFEFIERGMQVRVVVLQGGTDVQGLRVSVLIPLMPLRMLPPALFSAVQGHTSVVPKP